MRLTWQYPLGSLPSKYSYRYKGASVLDWTDMPGSTGRTAFAIEGLVPGSEYTADIRSHNADGPGNHAGVTFTTLSGVSTESAELPTEVALSQNYPNPFNPSTVIGYALPSSGHVHLAVYDFTGRTVSVLVDGVQPAGRHEVQFSASLLPTGTYIYRLRTDTATLTRNMTLVR